MQGPKKSIVRWLPTVAALVISLCIGSYPARCSAVESDQKKTAPQQLLARDAGTWDCNVKMFFKGPQAPPSESKGVEENVLICKGKFLQSTFKYAMGNRGEFEGHALMGYDARQKKFVGTWVDGMTTAPSQINAQYEEDTNTLTDHRTAVGGDVEFKSKLVTKWHDDANKTLTIYMIVDQDGKESEVKLMEMTAKKRK